MTLNNVSGRDSNPLILDVPDCFTNPSAIKIKEYPSLENLIENKGFDTENLGLNALFNWAKEQGQMTYDQGAPVNVVSMQDEAEYGGYVNSIAALRASVDFHKAKHTVVADQANRNYFYATFALAHKNPDHPINKDYAVQWRIELEMQDGHLVQTDNRFCIKTRDKDLVRVELEASMSTLDQARALAAIQQEYSDKLPQDLLSDPNEIAGQVFVSGTSVTSRTGYNSIQFRKKHGVMTLHQHSNDVQLVLTKRGPVAIRYELENEVEGGFGYSPVLKDDILRVSKGALDVHRAMVVKGARDQGIQLGYSSLSKAVFAEHAGQGRTNGTAAQPVSGYRDRVVTMRELQEDGFQVSDWFERPELSAVIIDAMSEIPAKGAVFRPSAKEVATFAPA